MEVCITEIETSQYVDLHWVRIRFQNTTSLFWTHCLVLIILAKPPECFMVMNSSDVYSNRTEINELMWYSWGSPETSGCITQSVTFVNGYNGIPVSQETWVVKSSVNKAAGTEEAASTYSGFFSGNNKDLDNAFEKTK